MDDRFFYENQNNNSKTKKNAGSEKISSLGSFDENIESKLKNQPSASKNSEFKVHISDYDSFGDFSTKDIKAPSYVPYGQSKTAPQKKSNVAKTPTAGVTESEFKMKASSKDISGTMVFNTKKATAEEKKKAVSKTQPSRTSVPSQKKPAAKAATNKKRTRDASPVSFSSFSTEKKENKSLKSQNKENSSNAKTSLLKKKENIGKKLFNISAENAEKRKLNFIKTSLTFLVCVIFISIISVTASSLALGTINDILVIDKGSSVSVPVEIPAGADFNTVFNILSQNGLIKQPFITKFFCKFRHYDKVKKKDEQGNIVVKPIEYEAGNYYLDSSSGVEAMLEEIMVRKNNAKDTVRLTFPEGWSIARIFQKIEKSGVCTADKLYANLDIVAKQYDFIKVIEPKSGRYLLAEGYLFPDTYDFFVGENATSILKKLFENSKMKWTAEYESRRKELGLTRDEIITIASIIQREAKDGSQMKDISSVVYNRLNDSASYPNLGLNSTSDYISSLKEFNLFSDFYYETYLDSYNTYSNQGLPPGPICNPGKTAIEAALYPSTTTYKFFCHSKTGEVFYASTAAEHKINTEKILYDN